MPWYTTKDGKHYNTDWFDKERQISENKKQADKLNTESKRKKRVDQKDVTANKIQEEIVGKDSYILSDEYQALSKEATKHWDKEHENADKIRELEKQLKAEKTVKPKSEWDTKDEISALLGDKPTTYTEKGEQLKKEIERLNSIKRGARNEWSKVTDKIQKIDDSRVEASRARWAKESESEKITENLKDDYFGFKKAETTTPYIDRLLKNGEAKVVQMSPKRYIAESAFKIFDNSSIEKTIRGRLPNQVANLMTKMEQGAKMNTPYLNYRDKEQEGLHRAIAAYLLGIDEIPVVIVPKKR